MFLLMYGVPINIIKMKELGIFMLMQRQIGAKIALGTISKKHIRSSVELQIKINGYLPRNLLLN